jgi:hypothetical protein
MSREAFEKWALQKAWGIDRDAVGEYYMCVQSAWEAWEAWQAAQHHSGMVLIDGRHLDAIISTLPGCADHGCVFNPKPAGAMGTNGGCHCLKNASRSQLTILSGRLSGLIKAAQEQQQ